MTKKTLLFVSMMVVAVVGVLFVVSANTAYGELGGDPPIVTITSGKPAVVINGATTITFTVSGTAPVSCSYTGYQTGGTFASPLQLTGITASSHQAQGIRCTNGYGTDFDEVEFNILTPRMSFTSPGYYSYTVPSGVRRIVAAVGGAGGGGGGCAGYCQYGGGAGGNGGVNVKALNVNPGDVIKIFVGEGGFGGQSNIGANMGGAGGGGGGASAVYYPDNGSRFKVVGGGGGGGGGARHSADNRYGYGGAGGSTGGGGGGGSGEALQGNLMGNAGAGGWGGGGGGGAAAGGSAGTGGLGVPIPQIYPPTSPLNIIITGASGIDGGQGTGTGGVGSYVASGGQPASANNVLRNGNPGGSSQTNLNVHVYNFPSLQVSPAGGGAGGYGSQTQGSKGGNGFVQIYSSASIYTAEPSDRVVQSGGSGSSSECVNVDVKKDGVSIVQNLNITSWKILGQTTGSQGDVAMPIRIIDGKFRICSTSYNEYVNFPGFPTTVNQRHVRFAFLDNDYDGNGQPDGVAYFNFYVRCPWCTQFVENGIPSTVMNKSVKRGQQVTFNIMSQATGYGGLLIPTDQDVYENIGSTYPYNNPWYSGPSVLGSKIRFDSSSPGTNSATFRFTPLQNAQVGHTYAVRMSTYANQGYTNQAGYGRVVGTITILPDDPVPGGGITINGANTISVQSGNTFSTQYTASGPSSVSSVDWSYNTSFLGVGFDFIPTTTTLGSPTTFRVTAPSGVTSTTTGTVRLNAYNTANHNNPPSTPFDVDVTIFPQSATPSLSASLSATPTSGVAPLTISATAQAQGTATGNINYTFYCNRSDTGTNVTMPYDHKLDNTTQNPYTRSNICTYSTPGTYTLKVIIERGSAVAQAQQTITVSSSTGPNFTLNVLPSEIVITRPTSGTAASTTLIFINGFSGFNSGLPTHANSAQFTVPSIRLQDGPDRSPSPSFGGWLISGINTVFVGVGTFTVSPTTELGTSTYMVRVTGTGLNGTVTKDVSVPVRVVAGPGGGGVADFALNPPNPNPLIIVRPTSGTLASSSSVLANNFTGFNPSVPNSNLVNCTSRLSRLSASLEESPIGATLPTPSPGAWSGSGGTGGLSSSCTSAMAFSIRSNTTPGIYTYRLSTIGTPPSGSALSKNTTQTVIVVPQGVSDVLSILPPRQTLVRPPAGSVSETMFNAVVSRVSGGYATINYKPYTITSPQYQGITVNPNYIYPDFPSSSGIEGPSGINFQDGSTINPSFLYETDLRGGVTWTHTQTGLGSISYRLIQNGSQATVQFDRDQGISTVTRGELTLTARTGSGISRSVQIPVTVSPMGQQLNPILVSITSSVPTTTRIIDIRSTVNPALQASFQLAILATSTTSTSTLPQCSDGIDNNDPEDSDADGSDPGCHTDFNPNNIASYDPNDNDETNTPSYTLRILPPKDITATSPIPTSVSFPIRVQRQQGFNGSVQLLFQPSGSLPIGVTYSFSPATLSSSQTNSTLTISAASNTILSAAQRQILFTVAGESSLTNEGSDSGSVTFAYSNDGCGCTYTSGVRFRDGKINIAWNCNDIDPTDRVELYRTYATYVSPPGITAFNNSNETGPISLTNGYDNDPGATTPSNNTIKAVRYQLKCIQGNGAIQPTANPNRDIIRKVFAPFGATILEQ